MNRNHFCQGPNYGHGGYGPVGYGAPVEEVEEVKKLPRFLLPWPLGWFIPGPVRRLPTLTLLAFSPIIIVPFVPFGIFELRLPLGWDGNYLAERIYGLVEMTSQSINGLIALIQQISVGNFKSWNFFDHTNYNG